MRIADGVVVIEIRVCLDENMVKSSAEETRGSKVEELGELVGEEREEAVDEEEDDDDPFKDSVDDEVWECSKFFFNEVLEGTVRHCKKIESTTEKNDGEQE